MPATAKTKHTPQEEIFDELQSLLKPYSPQLKACTGLVKNKRDYNLLTRKEVIVAGRKYDNLYFASLIEQKGYVGFYFMPIYCAPETRKSIAPGLLKLLKGKSCFHIKKLDGELRAQIAAALKQGFAGYKKNGWV